MHCLLTRLVMQIGDAFALRARESLAKLGHNLLVTFRKIDQEERRLKTPRSETQLSHEIGVTLENGLDWLAKIFEWKAVQEQKSE